MKTQIAYILKPVLMATLLTSGLTACSSPKHDQLKAFPAAEEGMQRIVIVLPHKERGEEDAFKVELIPGKVMMTDGVNQMRHGSAIEPRPLKGWGYTFYEITGKDVAISTMMAPSEGAKKEERFVQGSPLTIRYNSRLPIVIYAPKGYEVKYRIWKAGETRKTEEG